jgi:hypothetical protein
MKKLCREFNDDRDHASNANHQSQTPDPEKQGFCPNRKCPNVHEFATCVDDLQYLKSEWNEGVGGKKWWCQRKGKGWKWHAKKRVHKLVAGKEEWRVREAIAGLREAHKEGRYL